MTIEQSIKYLSANVDKARPAAFNAARTQSIAMMKNVEINDYTTALLARDAYNQGIVSLLVKVKTGQIEIGSNSEARALLISFARTSTKGVCRDFVRERKYDTQAIHENANKLLEDSVELRHVCGNRFTDPLQALLAKEKRQSANKATNALSDRDREILDTWLDLASSNPTGAKVLTAAKLGLSKDVVYQSIHRSKARLAKALR